MTAPKVILESPDTTEQQRFGVLCEQIRLSLKTAGVTSKALLATLPETRQRIFERRYPRHP